MDNKTKDALKQMQAELRQLQTLVTGIRPEEQSDDIEPEARPKKERGDAAVQITVSLPGMGGAKKPQTYVITELQIAKTKNEAAAALGYALASPQKIGLLRTLLGKDSESAAALGEATGLSTGSLYHHLRELMRADLVVQSGRNRYVLSPRGGRALLVVLALAVEE